MKQTKPTDQSEEVGLFKRDRTTPVSISIRFPGEIGLAVNDFCRKTVRAKTDVVNAATWYLFSRSVTEVEQIIHKYGESGGKLETTGGDHIVVGGNLKKTARSK